MLAVVEVKVISLLVHVAGLSTVTEATVKMLELGVKVDCSGVYDLVFCPDPNTHAKVKGLVLSNSLVKWGKVFHEFKRFNKNEESICTYRGV